VYPSETPVQIILSLDLAIMFLNELCAAREASPWDDFQLILTVLERWLNVLIALRKLGSSCGERCKATDAVKLFY